VKANGTRCAIAPGYDADLVLLDLNTARSARGNVNQVAAGVPLKAGTSLDGL